MAIIRDFKGLRPAKEYVEKIAELPYDVCNREEAASAAEGNPFNFYHITRSEIDLPKNITSYDPLVYQKASENLETFIQKGYLREDSKKSLYFYTLIMNGREQSGLTACVSIDDYIAGKIKKHELTREEKENDRIKHIDVTKAQTGLVFLFFKNNEDKKELWNDILSIAPEYDFICDDGIRHIFRLIDNDMMINRIKDLFAADELYIADGHHRAASAVKNGLSMRVDKTVNDDSEYNYFVSVIFPDNQLMIMSYNRVLKDLNGMTKDSFFEKIKENFSVEKTDKSIPSRNNEFIAYIESDWYIIKPTFLVGSDPIKSLDVSILQNYILSPVLNIDDPRTSKRIDFVGGIRGTDELKKLVDSGEYKMAISMYPTSIDELIKVADSGNIMPPKSTWFEPKLRDGLIIHKI